MFHLRKNTFLNVTSKWEAVVICLAVSFFNIMEIISIATNNSSLLGGIQNKSSKFKIMASVIFQTWHSTAKTNKYIHNNAWMFHKWKPCQSFKKSNQNVGHLDIFYVVSLRHHAGVLFSKHTHREDYFMRKYRLPKMPQDKDTKVEQIGWRRRNFKSRRCSSSLPKNGNVYIYLKNWKHFPWESGIRKRKFC